MCVELFEQPPVILPENNAVLTDFDQSRSELPESRTVEAYQVSLYSLAADANRMLDQLVDNIYAMNTEKLSPKAEKDYTHSTALLFTKVETTFDLPASTLGKALELRVHERLESEKTVELAAQVRAPVGFDLVHQRSGATDDVIEKIPMGFVRLRTQVQSEDSVEKAPIGYLNFTFKEGVPVEKIPMGFALKKLSEVLEAPAESTPIGYVHFPNTPLTENAPTKQIYLDLNTGYFGIK